MRTGNPSHHSLGSSKTSVGALSEAESTPDGSTAGGSRGVSTGAPTLNSEEPDRLFRVECGVRRRVHR